MTVRTNYAGSSTLAHQIENGAGADVFLSANAKWVDYLEGKGLVARRRDLLGNRLVIVVPADSPGPRRRLEDLLEPDIERLALADPDAVPAGIYAKEALVKTGAVGRGSARRWFPGPTCAGRCRSSRRATPRRGSSTRPTRPFPTRSRWPSKSTRL